MNREQGIKGSRDKEATTQAYVELATFKADARWMLVIPEGEVESFNGNFHFDKDSADRVLQLFKHQGVDVVVDYDHGSVPGHAPSSGIAPAAGWIKDLKYVAGKGLFARIEWNERARDHLENKEFRYLSPTVYLDEDRKVTGLDSVALTNRPAIRGGLPVAASKVLFLGGTDMPEKKQANQMPEDEGATPDQLLGRLEQVLRNKNVGLPEGAGRNAILEAAISFIEGGSTEGGEEGGGESEEVAASVRKELGLKPDAPKEEVMLALSAKSGKDAENSKLQEKVNELSTWKAEREAEDLVTGAVKNNKLNPNSKEQMGWARDYAKKDPDGFKKFIAAQSAYVPPGKTAPPASSGDTARADEDTMIANAVKEHEGDYGKAITALQINLKKPFLEQGLTNAAANKAATERYPKIFGAAA